MERNAENMRKVQIQRLLYSLMEGCKAKIIEKAIIPKVIMDIIRAGPVLLNSIFSFHDFLMTKNWKDYTNH